MTEISPYTRGIAECLSSLEDPVQVASCKTSLIQLLTNLLQGRILDYLSLRIREHYHLEDQELGESFSLLLIDIFKDEIFGNFRRKVEENPDLLLIIGRQIVETEMGDESPRKKKTDLLFFNIFHQYLEYKELDLVVETLQFDSRIQKLLLTAMLQKTNLTSVSSSMATKSCSPS